MDHILYSSFSQISVPWNISRHHCAAACTQAIAIYHKNKIEFGPAKAANAGGVAVSGLEMAQNSARLSWSKEEVDEKLKGIMTSIFNSSKSVSCRPCSPCSSFSRSVQARENRGNPSKSTDRYPLTLGIPLEMIHSAKASSNPQAAGLLHEA